MKKTVRNSDGFYLTYYFLPLTYYLRTLLPYEAGR